MKMLNFEEFIEFYNKYSRCINDIGFRNKPINDKQLQTRYKAYTKSQERKKLKLKQKLENKDTQYEKLVSIVRNRDKVCRLYSLLVQPERSYIDSQMFGELYTLDVAHIFGKGAFPHMKYDSNNCVLLYRYFHRLIDDNINPFTNDYMNSQEKEELWKTIIGLNSFESLRKKAYKIDK